MAENKFKVGDRVHTVETVGGYTFDADHIPGTVVSVLGESPQPAYYLVDLDYVPTYDGEPSMSGARNWPYQENEIEHITNNTEEN